MNTRNKVLICNLLIIILCILSISSYFFMPFWKVEAKYTLSADTLDSILPATKANEGEGNTDNTLDADDIYNNLDFAEIIGDSTWEKLPYNVMAGAKYKMLGMQYGLE